jgi:hypothetical protein
MTEEFLDNHTDIIASVYGESDRDELQQVSPLSVLRLVFPHAALSSLVNDTTSYCQVRPLKSLM